MAENKIKKLAKTLYEESLKHLHENELLTDKDVEHIIQNPDTSFQKDNYSYIVFYTGINNMMTYNQYRRYQTLCKCFGVDNVYINMHINKNDILPWQFKIQAIANTYNIPYEKIALFNFKNEIISFGDVELYTEDLKRKIEQENKEIVFIHDNYNENKEKEMYNVIDDNTFVISDQNTQAVKLNNDKKTNQYLVSNWNVYLLEEQSDDFWNSLLELIFNPNIERDEKILEISAFFDDNNEQTIKFLQNVEKQLVELYLVNNKFDNFSTDVNHNIDINTVNLFGYNLFKTSNLSTNIDTIYKKLIDANNSELNNKVKNMLKILFKKHGKRMFEMYSKNPKKKINEITTNLNIGGYSSKVGAWVHSFDQYYNNIQKLIKDNNYEWVVGYDDKRMYQEEDIVANNLVYSTNLVLPFIGDEIPTDEQKRIWLDLFTKQLGANLHIDGANQLENLLNRLNKK